MTVRPNFEDISSAEEFDNWYWMKEELVALCKDLEIPANGRKNVLRQRIMNHMSGVKEEVKSAKPSSKFNWAKEKLTPQTELTDSVTFGSNFRSFMKVNIDGFVCSAEFMDWVKKNMGKTLEDVVNEYPNIQADIKRGRKMDKSDFNVMNAYIDEFLRDNPNLKRDHALACWNIKKYLPAKRGLVRYDSHDL
ncbi:MAG: SAP domain-containing protein, partial [Ekhidna sp.]|nr:SAP domain-containing protein [Ekhidna sp.]